MRPTELTLLATTAVLVALSWLAGTAAAAAASPDPVANGPIARDRGTERETLPLEPLGGGPGRDPSLEILDATVENVDPSLSSVYVAGRVRGPRGDGLLRLRKTNPKGSWYDIHAHVDDFFRGSPEWAAEIFGVDLARFLGFRKISEDEYLVPDAGEMNLALAELNRASAAAGLEPVLIAFYAVSINLVNDEDYTRRFEENGGQPVGAYGREAQHDILYHLSTFAIPNEALALLRRHSRIFRNFRDFLRDHHGSIYASHGLAYLRQRPKWLATDVDNFLASVTHAFRYRLRFDDRRVRPDANSEEVFRDWAIGPLRGGKSAEAELRDYLQYFVNKGALPADLVNAFLDEKKKVDREISRGLSFPVDQLLARTRAKMDFFRGYAARHAPPLRSSCEGTMLAQEPLGASVP